MNIKERFQKVIEYFEEHMPIAETELEYNDPFGLLVSVILSAQCTDKRVNMITPALMKQFPDAAAMAQADPAEIFKLIRSCSYPNNKAKHLHAMAEKLITDYNGKVPETFDDLIKLPGVGRKTANVIRIVAFGKPAMPVDTHVFRVSARLGLTTNSKTPESTEKQLVRHFPRHLLTKAHHWLILHGRYVCHARRPNCSGCGLKHCCNYYQSGLSLQSQKF